MSHDDDDAKILGRAALGAALFGPAGAALGLVGAGREAPARPWDAAPIGSDPWLGRELRAALAKAGLEAALEVEDAVVQVDAPKSDELARALGSVQGVKAIRYR